MLHLQSQTDSRWLRQVDEGLEEILIDHAHCEKKAARMAMHLIFAYTENEKLCREMTEIVGEELEHFLLVLDWLQRRSIRFRRQKPSTYGRKLSELIRRDEPHRAVDQLLIASLIEARSCERFQMLADHIRSRDAELAEFYTSLFESEARHHTTYVRLATHYADEAVVAERLEELAAQEARILAEGDSFPRMHS